MLHHFMFEYVYYSWQKPTWREISDLLFYERILYIQNVGNAACFFLSTSSTWQKLHLSEKCRLRVKCCRRILSALMLLLLITPEIFFIPKIVCREKFFSWKLVVVGASASNLDEKIYIWPQLPRIWWEICESREVRWEKFPKSCAKYVSFSNF